MKTLIRLLVAAATLSAVSSHAVAQSEKGWGALYPSVFLATDYRYDGASFTGHKPTVQGSLYWAHPRDFYAGLWASGVDFSDLGDVTTSYEVDLYAGRNFDVGKTRLSLEGMYTVFPDNEIPGPTYDFFTAKLRASRSFAAVSVGAALSYVPEAPYAGGPQWRFVADASHRWNTWLTSSAKIGRRWSQLGRDRSFWDVGATARWNKVAFDLRYSTTNQNFAECGFIDWCESGLTLTMQVDLWK